MSKIENFTISPTENARVGRSSIAQFIYECIQSIKANNINGIYDALISDCESLYNEVFSDISLNKQNISKQVTLTKVVKTVKNEFGNILTSFEAAFIYKFGKNSIQHREAFPKGVGPYKKVNIEEITEKMELAESHANKYDVDLGTTFGIQIKTVRLKYIDSLSNQKSTQTQVKSIIPDYKTKKVLIDKLFLKIIATLLLNNLDQPSAICNYFNMQLISPRSKTKKNDNNMLVNIKLPVSSHKAANIILNADDDLLISNPGTISVFYYTATTADAAVPAILNEVLPDEEIEVSAASLGAPFNKYIIFVNKDTTSEAEVEIVLV